VTTLSLHERLDHIILVIRDQNVILDADLAVLYGVPTKALNQAVKRNRERFPDDFMFRLTRAEKEEVVTNCDHLERLKFSPTLPHAFTEHGALMVASVLNSPVAVEVSIRIVRVFIRLREALASDTSLGRRLQALEQKYDRHDVQIQEIFDAIHALMEPPPPVSKRRIGFRPLPEDQDVSACRRTSS
jgi:hypothetical protein